MSFQPTSLLFVSAFLLSLSLYFLSLSIFVDRRRQLYIHFFTALFGATIFIFCGFLLTGPMPDHHVVIVHRWRSLGLLTCLVGYQYTLCHLYAPRNHAPRYFLRISLLFLAVLPFPLFLREPAQHLAVHFLGGDFHFRLGAPGPFYRLYSVVVIVSFLYTLSLILRSRASLSKLFGVVGMLPVIVGGANDFLVAQGHLRSILISEYFFFLFITPIYIVFLREEQHKQRNLEKLNLRLEAEVQARTRELEASNRVLAAEKEHLEQSLTQIRTLRGLLPICAGCKNIRDDAGYWHQVEEYFEDHGEVEFTHSYCPDCMRRLYPEMYEDGASAQASAQEQGAGDGDEQDHRDEEGHPEAVAAGAEPGEDLQAHHLDHGARRTQPDPGA